MKTTTKTDKNGAFREATYTWENNVDIKDVGDIIDLGSLKLRISRYSYCVGGHNKTMLKIRVVGDHNE